MHNSTFLKLKSKQDNNIRAAALSLQYTATKGNGLRVLYIKMIRFIQNKVDSVGCFEILY
jgi:hypothetical protein